MLLVSTYLPADQLPDSVDDSSVGEQTGVFTRVGSVFDLEPVKTTELRVKLDPGHYV